MEKVKRNDLRTNGLTARGSEIRLQKGRNNQRIRNDEAKR